MRLVADERGGPEHCWLPPSELTRLGVEVGHQVRLRHDDQCALYTVVGTADDVTVSSVGRARLGTDGPVSVEREVVTPSEAPTAGAFVERHVEGDRSLVVCAPHGGFIEPYTDEQAMLAGERAGGTIWYCKGWWPDGGAFDRWHITSNDIHPDCFPGLEHVAQRTYDHALSFHGWRGTGVGVGGLAPRRVRETVRDAVERVLPADLPVTLEESGPYSGSQEANLVNWLAHDGGVQLEQCGTVRREHAERVTRAAVDALADV